MTVTDAGMSLVDNKWSRLISAIGMVAILIWFVTVQQEREQQMMMDFSSQRERDTAAASLMFEKMREEMATDRENMRVLYTQLTKQISEAQQRTSKNNEMRDERWIELVNTLTDSLRMSDDRWSAAMDANTVVGQALNEAWIETASGLSSSYNRSIETIGSEYTAVLDRVTQAIHLLLALRERECPVPMPEAVDG